MWPERERFLVVSLGNRSFSSDGGFLNLSSLNVPDSKPFPSLPLHASCPTLQDHRDCSPLDSSVCGTWDSPGKNTAVGCHALLQEIFLTQGWNPVSRVPCIPGRLFTASHREGLLPPPKLVLMSSFFLHLIEGV